MFGLQNQTIIQLLPPDPDSEESRLLVFETTL